METKPIEFEEFIRGSFEKIEEIGGEVFLGYVENGIWTNYVKGENQWNAVKAVFPGKEPRYRKIDSFFEDYNNYVKTFYKMREMIEAGL